MIAAEVDGRRQDLLVDSGSSDLVLFGRSPMARRVTAITNGGSVQAWAGRARVSIGGTYTRMIPTIEVPAPPLPGLLPAVAFSSVYVSNRGGVVVLVP
jgi:predicted aspartyl protease